MGNKGLAAQRISANKTLKKNLAEATPLRYKIKN